MINSNILKIPFIKVKRNKFNILRIIITSFSIAIVLFSVSFNSVLNAFWDSSVDNAMDYRTLFVEYDYEKTNESKVIKTLSNMLEVESAQPYSSYLVTMQSNDYKVKDEDNNFYLAGAIDKPVNIIKGSDLSNYKPNEKVMICPKLFFPDLEADIQDYTSDKVIDLSSALNKKISISFLDETKEEYYKIVGLYDSAVSNMTGNVCYTKFENVKEINLKYQPEAFEDDEKQYSPVLVVLKNVRKLKSFENKIKNYGYQASEPVVKINTEIGDDISDISMLISMVSVIISIGLNIAFISNELKKNKPFYALMEVYGFSKSVLRILNLIEQIIICLLGFIVSLPLSRIINKMFEMFFVKNNIIFNKIQISLSLNSILITFIVSIIISIITTIVTLRKYNDFSLIEVLKE